MSYFSQTKMWIESGNVFCKPRTHQYDT